jgi:transposase
MHLKIKAYLRTQEVASYIQARFNVAYSVSGTTRLLHRLGFVYKKAKIIPGKADAVKQQAFLVEYKALKQNKRLEDVIYFGDGCHPHHNVIPAYGWVEKGKDHEVKSNTGRERLNLYGAVNAQNHKAVVMSEPTVNADSVIRLCEKLLNLHVQGFVYLILDNARYQRSKKVAEFLKSHPQMQIKYLPSYSPNLNLIERLWLFFQKKMLYNHYYKDLKTFEQAALYFFNNLGRYRKELSTLLADNFRVIGAN